MNEEASDKLADNLKSEAEASLAAIPPNLQLNAEEFRRLGYQVVDLMSDYLATIRERKVYTPMSLQQRELVMEQTLPEGGTAPEEIIRQFEELVLPYPMGNGHPRFFG
jgi:hypothetical protein